LASQIISHASLGIHVHQLVQYSEERRPAQFRSQDYCDGRLHDRANTMQDLRNIGIQFLQVVRVRERHVSDEWAIVQDNVSDRVFEEVHVDFLTNTLSHWPFFALIHRG